PVPSAWPCGKATVWPRWAKWKRRSPWSASRPGNLDGDLPIQLGVARLVDRAEGRHGDLADHLKAAQRAGAVGGRPAGGRAGLQAKARPARWEEDLGRRGRLDQLDGVPTVRADQVHRKESEQPERETQQRDSSIIFRRGPASSGKSLRAWVDGA